MSSRRLLLAVSPVALALLEPSTAGAMAPLPAVEVEYDLGDHDTSIVPHEEYALMPTTPPVVAENGINKLGGGAACASDPPAYSWARVWSNSDDFGNDTFGAGYDGSLLISSTAAAGNTPDKMRVNASVRAFATVFGEHVTLAKAYGDAKLTGNEGFYQVNISVLDYLVFADTEYGALTGSQTYPQTFFEAGMWFTLGPLPVHVTASVAGEVGIAYDVHNQGNTIHASFDPSARAYATASAGIDVLLAGAGIEGQLTLVETHLPATAVVSLYPNGVHYTADVDVTMKALNGKLSVWAKLGWEKWKKTIATWPAAVDETFPIFHADNCSQTIEHAVCGNGSCHPTENYGNCPQDCPQSPPPDPGDGGGDDGGDGGGEWTICDKFPWKCPDTAP